MRKSWLPFSVFIATIATILLPVNSASATDYFSVSDPKDNTIIDCRIDGNQIEPGKLSQATNRFRSLKTALEQIERRIAKKPVNIAKLKGDLKKKKKEYNNKKKLCLKEAPSLPTPSASVTPRDGTKPTPTNTPESDPTSKSTPTRAPTATPLPGGCAVSCYDSQRNTSCFKIPSGTQGNESNGSRIATGCLGGCHSEVAMRNRSFDMISAALKSVPAMKPFASSYSTKDIADLAAYLNRFNAKQCKSDWP